MDETAIADFDAKVNRAKAAITGGAPRPPGRATESASAAHRVIPTPPSPAPNTKPHRLAQAMPRGASA